MKLLSDSITVKKQVEIIIIQLIMLTYLFRVAIPLLKFPFLALFGCFIIYFFLRYEKELLSGLKQFIRDYYLLLLPAFILFLSFLFSDKLYLIIFKDVVNTVILLSIFFMSLLIVRGKNELAFFSSNLINLVIVFAMMISILGILDFFHIYSFIDYSRDTINGLNDYQASVDYNFALLPAFFGMFGVFYFLIRIESRQTRILLNLLLFVFSVAIILSGSRRGVFLLGTVFVLLILARLYAFYKQDSLFILVRLGIVSGYFISTTFLLVLITYLITFRADYSLKIKLLESIGSKNISDTKEKIAIKAYKYYSVLNHTHSFNEFYYRIFPIVPEDPDSGWGTRIHKTVFPLIGNNATIVPANAKGYLMDSTCNASTYSGLSESYTSLAILKANDNDSFKASVYCFVSDSFDGDVVTLTVASFSINNSKVTGRVSANYDLLKKGMWQKLEIQFSCRHGEIPVLMSFWKNGVEDFSKLKGYVIFAYPMYEKVDSKTEKVQNSEVMNTFDDIPSKSDIKKESFLLTSKFISNKKNFASASFADLPHSFIHLTGTYQDDSDPIRRFAAKFISEDTTYHAYKANIVLDTISNSFIADRLSRWEFALKIYSMEFSLRQKIFGGGFNFLNWYGYYFYKDKTRSDYPHNPFLSVLLYSGILGLMIYLFLMYKVFYYYYKYFNEYKILAIFFLITFFFSFFSAGSPFDPPIMGFFNILPFFIHAVHKRGAGHRAEGSGEE